MLGSPAMWKLCPQLYTNYESRLWQNLLIPICCIVHCISAANIIHVLDLCFEPLANFSMRYSDTWVYVSQNSDFKFPCLSFNVY